MRLEHDLEIRSLAGNILPDDLGMDIGDGWRDVVIDELVALALFVAPHIVVRKVGEKWGLLDIRCDLRGLDENRVLAVLHGLGRTRARSANICELCGLPGEVRRTGWHRVRCDGCEEEHLRRREFVTVNRRSIDEAAAYYIAVCLEHERLFPVENITIQAWPDDVDRRHFIDEVNTVVGWWRAGSWIEGVGDQLREEFRRLRFP